MSDTDQREIDVEQFVQLLTTHQQRILTYILTLLPNLSDAEDVLQETSLVLWRKFGEYRPGSNFLAWARNVAKNMVRNHLAKKHRCRVKFDEQLFVAVAAEVEGMDVELDAAKDAVIECVEELPTDDKVFLQASCEHGATIKSAALAAGRSVEGAYKVMRRIYDDLYSCVLGKLESEGIHVRKS